MPAARSSSDSSGGGAPLYSSRAMEATPHKDNATSKSSDPPSDDEMALVKASGQFNLISNDATAPRPAVSNDPYNYGQQLQRPGTVRPPAAFGSQSPYRQSSNNAVNNGVPPSIASSPLYRGFGDIQAKLMTAQQFVRTTPGFTDSQAQTVRHLLVGCGQDLTHFATTLITEHTKAHHQVGELRLQYEKAQNELLSRRQQISDLQDQYKSAKKEKDVALRDVEDLESRLNSCEREVKRLRQLGRSHDEKHAMKLQRLEDELKSLRVAEESNMQLVKVQETPTPKSRRFVQDDSASDEDDDNSTSKAAETARRGSFLNPTAAEFGPRSSKPDHSKEMLPLLRKYAQRTGPAMSPQDVRAYDGSNDQPRMNPRPATRMGFRGNSFSFNSGQNGSWSAMTGPLGPPHLNQSRTSGGGYKSAADTVDIDFSTLQEKTDWSADDVTIGFQRLFGMIEGLIAKHYVNEPFNESENILPMSHPETWRYILSMGLKNQTQSATHMADLLTKFHCRHWVLKRVIVDYIINRMIIPEVFFGFNPQIDEHLHALQGRMKSRAPGSNMGRPQGMERQRIVMDHAKVIRFIIEAPEGPSFKERTVAKHAQMIQEILKPLRSCVVEDEQARKGLSVVVNAAWTITTHIWTSGMTIHFYFPETGSKFAYGTMRSLNYTDTPSDQMQYQQYRIMLVITPTLSLRDDRDLDRLRTHELLKSDVLVMR
ncbi:hypothetical protein JX265_006566 [Neoarthrinium moseri]|uniref:Uncharacterized protein n=1 Tax=Neoarthrinium moseri TaxID=1658444 RepID=A0A9P9WLA9_9PEZI|nr:hypothetical protein JX265_006566 [Neoarthrinium moseri]